MRWKRVGKRGEDEKKSIRRGTGEFCKNIKFAVYKKILLFYLLNNFELLNYNYMEEIKHFIECANAEYSSAVLMLFVFVLVIDWAFEIKGEFAVVSDGLVTLMTLLLFLFGFVDGSSWFFAAVGIVHLFVKGRKKE